AQSVQIGVRNIARRAVVLNQVVVMLVVRLLKLAVGAQVVRGRRIRMQRTRSGTSRRITSARAGARRLSTCCASDKSGNHNEQCATHRLTPQERASGTWQWLRSLPAGRDGRESPGFRLTPEQD